MVPELHRILSLNTVRSMPEALLECSSPSQKQNKNKCTKTHFFCDYFNLPGFGVCGLDHIQGHAGDGEGVIP